MRKKRVFWLIIIIISIIIIVFLWLFMFSNKYKIKDLKLKVNGQKNIQLEYGDEYNDMGAVAYYKDINLTKNIKINTNIDLKKIGKYYYKYTIKYKNLKKESTRNIIIKDSKKPEIILNGQSPITIYQNSNYEELGAKANDNYDGDITSKIVTSGEVNTKQIGEYEIRYSVKDSSGNEQVIKREIKVIEIPKSSNKTSSKGYKIEKINGIYYVNGILVANKTFDLPSSYNPGGLLSEFQNNFDNMQKDAANEGINLKIISGFRSYNSQKSIYNNYVARDGQDAADRYSARPGYSEHQTGLAADINSLDQAFENTKEGIWLNKNCYKYGFIIRYVKGKENITGYMFEPWHIRYVGVDIAKQLYNNGNWITLEEYLGIDSRYN